MPEGDVIRPDPTTGEVTVEPGGTPPRSVDAVRELLVSLIAGRLAVA